MSATVELRSEHGHVRIEALTGRVRLVVVGTPDEDVTTAAMLDLSARLAATAALDIDATAQDGAMPELRSRITDVLTRRPSVTARVLTGSAQVELSYRRLSQSLPGRVEVSSPRATASTVVASPSRPLVPATPIPDCPPPVRSDPRRWPVLVITPPGEISDPEMEAFLGWYRNAVVARGEPFGLVLDLRNTGGMSPRQRRMITDGMGEPGANRCRALGMVFDSIVLRGVLTAIFWVRKPSYPTRVFGQVDQAAAFVAATLAEERSGAAAR